MEHTLTDAVLSAVSFRQPSLRYQISTCHCPLQQFVNTKCWPFQVDILSWLVTFLFPLCYEFRHCYHGNAGPLQRVCIQRYDTLLETGMQNLVSNWVQALKYFWNKQSDGLPLLAQGCCGGPSNLFIIDILVLLVSIMGTGVAQSVWCLTTTGLPGFDLRQRQGIFLLASASRPAQGSAVLSPEVKRGRGVTLTTHSHLVPWLRMSRSYTSSPRRRLHDV
jgi:hypothetical protein